MYNVLNKSACTVTSEKKWEDVLDLREIPWRPLFLFTFFKEHKTSLVSIYFYS